MTPPNKVNLSTNLDPDIIRHLALLNQPAHKVEIRIARSGVCNLDLLEAALDEGIKEDRLLGDRHGIREGLVPIAEVGGQPDRRRPVNFSRPLAVGEVERGVWFVLDGGIPAAWEAKERRSVTAITRRARLQSLHMELTASAWLVVNERGW